MPDPIRILDYDPHWPELFEQEKRRLLLAAGDTFMRVEHVGSTSVPGLGAKPIIDILAAVRTLGEVLARVEALKGIGYEYVPEYEAELPERRYFQKGRPRTHHLHVVEPQSEFWSRLLLFRDYLRAHPETAADYERLKRELAKTCGADREGYTNAKTAFVRSVERSARDES
jgi:GrpB-like predicted nucleotidyltransferase (UPF0157 family)